MPESKVADASHSWRRHSAAEGRCSGEVRRIREIRSFASIETADAAGKV